MWFHRTNIIWILISFSCMTSCHSTNQTVTAGAGSSSPVDKLADIVTKMQSLARLVNGISLEIGFIDGSIPSDDAIAELLYTDPSKLQEMMSVNSSVANRITNGFDTIYSDISSAPDNVKIMEKRLAVLEDISLILDTVSLEKVDSKDYGTKLRDVGEFVNKFTQIHEKYWTEMKKYLDDMHRIFTHLVTDSPTDSEIEQTVESFPDYVKTFENVQKAVPYFEQVVTVLRRAKEIDNMFLVFRPLIFESQLRSQLASTGKYDQESIDLLDGITDSQHKLQALRSMALKMKSVDGREALALKTSFPDSQKIAFDLGLAVLGVSTIKKVIDNRSELAPLTKELKDIEEAAGNSTEDISTLQDLKSSVISMFKGIDDFLSSDFSSDGKIFEEAAKIPGIAGFNYKSLKAAVEAVDTTGKFSGIVNALEVITNLDLDFEKYDIKSASSSLKALDAFFNKYEATLFPPTTTIPPATPLSSPAPSNQSPPSQPQPGPRGSSPPAPSAPSAPETDTNSLALVDLTDSPADPTPEVSGFMWFILISYILFFVMGTAGTVFFVKRFLKTGQNVKPKTPKKKINGNSSAKDDVTSHHNSDPLRSARS